MKANDFVQYLQDPDDIRDVQLTDDSSESNNLDTLKLSDDSFKLDRSVTVNAYFSKFDMLDSDIKQVQFPSELD